MDLTAKSPAIGQASRLPADLGERRSRAMIWRAVAGMAVAVALGCAVVLVEFSSELARRTDHFQNRIKSLRNSLLKTDRESKNIKRELASEDKQVSLDAGLRSILLAADFRAIKLSPAADHRSGANGVVLLSRAQNKAILAANGLEPTDAADVYRLWWVGARGARIKGAEFTLSKGGAITVSASSPPGDLRSIEAVLTIGPRDFDPHKPSGVVALRGR